MLLNQFDSKVQFLLETYLKEQANRSNQLIENQLEVETNELIAMKQEFEKSKSANLKLQQKIQEYEKSNKKLVEENQFLNSKFVQSMEDNKVAMFTDSKDLKNDDSTTVHEKKKLKVNEERVISNFFDRKCKRETLKEQISVAQQEKITQNFNFSRESREVLNVIQRDDQKVSCDIFDGQFKNKRHLRRHIKTIHEKREKSVNIVIKITGQIGLKNMLKQYTRRRNHINAKFVKVHLEE